MKVKLLRKLRKRFYWYREENDTCWRLYDKKYNHVRYCFETGFYYINDMLIWNMMKRLFIDHEFFSLRDRVEKKRKERKEIQLKNKFSKHF